MSEEVNKIIDNLCSKLGTSAKFLIPELTKMHIAEGIVSLIIVAVIMGGMIFVIKKAWDCATNNKLDLDIAAFTMIFAGIAFLVAVVFFAMSVCDLAGWIASPTAKAVMEIADMVR